MSIESEIGAIHVETQAAVDLAVTDAPTLGINGDQERGLIALSARSIGPQLTPEPRGGALRSTMPENPLLQFCSVECANGSGLSSRVGFQPLQRGAEAAVIANAAH